MARVKRGVTAGRRHKKVLGKAKGYYNARRKVYRAAKQAVIKAGQYAYRDRRAKKREFRALWIARINAARASTAVLQPHHQRPEQGRTRDRPQDARGSRRARCRGFWRDRAAGEDRSRHRLNRGDLGRERPDFPQLSRRSTRLPRAATSPRSMRCACAGSARKARSPSS